MECPHVATFVQFYLQLLYFNIYLSNHSTKNAWKLQGKLNMLNCPKLHLQLEIELLATKIALKLSTQPYVVFVDQNYLWLSDLGRIFYHCFSTE